MRRLAIPSLAWATLLVLPVMGGCSCHATRPPVHEASKYDVGPRAIEEPANPVLAEAGARLFASEPCMNCHVLAVGYHPDLLGVSTRRTAQWLEQFILHPEVMVREDPIARKLILDYTIQMPNFELTPAQARSLIEYFKHQDRGRAPIALSAH